MVVDEQAIIQGVHGLKIEGDENGLIRRFGVLLNNYHVDYYNHFSFNFAIGVIESHGMEFVPIAQQLLIYAAQDCAVNTFFGIMSSDEWKSLVGPMIDNDEDKIKALVAFENALGWAKVEFVSLDPGKKLVLRSQGGYEAEGFKTLYEPKTGKANSGVCHMLAGVTAGFMDLIYGGGIGPENLGTFQVVETKCIAKGDEYCEFVATPRED